MVDTAPQVAQDRIIQRADFVVIPVRPSPNDLRAVGETLAVDFAVSMIEGLAVCEMAPQSRSTVEITELWKYVDTQMRKYA